jgi:toxin FitB
VSFLLDTNVVSEWVKPHPDSNVIAWLAEVDEDRVFISVISFAELRRGIERMPAGRRRERLALWLSEELPARFEDRILGIDRQIAEAWGIIMVRGEKAGAPFGSMDAMVAAIAQTHELTLVTRNVKDFRAVGISLLDPWEPAP